MSTKKTGFARFLAPISLGAVMFSTYVGPGFASGTQTVQYFLTKGWVGVFVGLLVVGLVSFVLQLVFFEFYRVYRPMNYRENADNIYRHPVARVIFGTWTDITNILTPLVSIAAQIAAAALLLYNLFNVPTSIGTFVFCIVIIALALFGAKLLLKVGSFLTMAIIGVTIYVAITGIPNAWGGTMQFLAERSTPEDYGITTTMAWYTMIIFSGNFLAGMGACANASRGVLVTRKDVLTATLTNIGLCVLSTMVYTFVFAAGMPGITKEELPTLWAIQNLCGGTRGAQILYAVLAMAAMISTGVALIFSVANRWEKPLAKAWTKSTPFIRQLVIAVVIVLLCTVGASFGVIAIVTYGFMSISKISFPVSLMLPFFVMIWRMKTDKKKGLIGEDGYYIHADSLEKIAAEG